MRPGYRADSMTIVNVRRSSRDIAVRQIQKLATRIVVVLLTGAPETSIGCQGVSGLGWTPLTESETMPLTVIARRRRKQWV
jgi:hypothetical protein